MELHCVRYQNEQGWTARCIEYDFVGEAATPDGALENLMVALIGELRFAQQDGRRPFEGLPAPPEAFLHWYNSEQHKESTRKQLDVPRTLLELAPKPWMLVSMESATRVV